MKAINELQLLDNQAGLWFLGQAGYIIRATGVTVTIDPYLSDSVKAVAPDCARLLPVPIAPDKLEVDIFVVTHDHLDHLDPETISPYAHKDTTAFVAPHLASRKLIELGVPEGNLHTVDAGEEDTVKGVRVCGVHAEPSEEAVVDTAGYYLEFANGRSIYHTSDTGFSQELLDAAPAVEVLLTCINGKWCNLNVDEAVRLTQAVKPHIAIPNHYDMMAPNLEDPGAYVAALKQAAPEQASKILNVMEPFIWE
jgi:L-ascorbate 6-phosphate lactonase